MDWLGLQHKIRQLHAEYFDGQEWTEPKIEFARSKDTGDKANNIDAVIRAIAREGRFGPLSPDEKDILAIRLDWALSLSIRESQRPFEPTNELTEDDIENILIDRWHAEGRNIYQPHRGIHRERGGKPTIRIVPHKKQQPPAEISQGPTSDPRF